MIISRRIFNKFLAACGLGAFFTRYNKLFAASFFSLDTSSSAPNTSSSAPDTSSSSGAATTCSDLVSDDSAISWGDSNIVFWIDGFYYSNTQLNSNAYFAILLKFQQTSLTFINKVILCDVNKNIVYARYYEATDKISSSFLPYLIFNNVSLSQSTYYLYIQTLENGSTLHYRYAFAASTLSKSTLTNTDLPAVVRADLIAAAHSGQIYSSYYFSKSLMPSMNVHNVRVWVQQITTDNAFTIQIAFMHQDIDVTHYMRYFIVTDPVGRILGLLKRSAPDPTVSSVQVMALTEADRNYWGLTQDKVAKINDCPYIMVFCDDLVSLVKTTVWLR
jgi:hypothetical protein